MKTGKVLFSRASSLILSVILTVAVTAGALSASPLTGKVYAGEAFKVTITNKDDKGNALSGCDFEILKDGKTVMTYTSDGSPKVVSLAAGKYVLRQTKAAAGYRLADDVSFEVEEDGTLVGNGTDEFKVQGLGLEFHLLEDQSYSGTEKDGAPVYTRAGEKGQYKDKDGNLVAWESNYGATMNRITVGGDQEYVYCFNKNKQAPTSRRTLTYYSQNSVPEIIEKAAKAKGENAKDFYSHILGILQNGFPNNASGLRGSLTDRQFYAVTQWAIWKYTDGISVSSDLKQSPKDTIAPDGAADGWTPEMQSVYSDLLRSTYSGGKVVRFLNTSDPEFQNMIGARFIDRDQNVTVVNYKDDSKFTVKKVDDSGEPVVGAVLQIKERTGSGTLKDEPVCEWKTDGSAREFDRSDFTNPYGYSVVESGVPDGYAKAIAVNFLFDSSGMKVNSMFTGYNNWEKSDEAVITLVDAKKHEVGFNKVDIDTGSPLKGAELALVSGKSEKGKTVIDSWTTDGTSHKLSLEPGYYTLVEREAPDGYETAPSVTFYLNKDGRITVYGTDGKWSSYEEAFVTMQDSKDEKYPNRHSINVSKVDAGTGDDLAGAELDVVIGKDEGGTSVARWTTDGRAHKMRSLPEGIYTLVERKAPEGYDIADPITFRIDSEGKVHIVDADGTESEAQDGITMSDTETPPTPVIPSGHHVSFAKVDSDTGSSLAGAELELVTGSGDGGTSVDKWTTDGTSHDIYGLAAGTYTLVERTAPEGYEVADPITFRLDETGLIHIVGSDGTESEAQAAAVTMKDDKKPAEIPPTDEETKPRGGGGTVVDDNGDKTTVRKDSGGAIRRKAVKAAWAPKTGDDSSFAAWIVVAAAAFAASRRRQKNQRVTE